MDDYQNTENAWGCIFAVIGLIIIGIMYYFLGSLMSWLCGVPLWAGIIIALLFFSGKE